MTEIDYKYVAQTNAVCLTVYHPQGEDIPSDVVKRCIESVQAIVDQHSLLVGVATT